MFTKQDNFTYDISNSCDTCKNNDICHYKKEKLELDNDIKEMKSKISIGSPIQLKCICNRFEKKNESIKRGFYYE